MKGKMDQPYILVEEFLAYLKFEKNYSFNTLRSYSFDLKNFLKFIQKKNLTYHTIGSFDISEWLDYLHQKKLKPCSIARKLSAQSVFFDYLLRRDKIAQNYFNLFTAPKSDKIIPTTLTVQEIDSLIENMSTKNILERRNKYIFILLYSTGIRSEELCSLTCDNVFLETNMIKVSGKGKKYRYVPLISIARKSIELWLEERSYLNKNNINTLFLSNNGFPLTTSMIRKIVDKNTNTNNILSKKKIHPHVFRYTFATHLLDNQSNLRHIQELLGHATISATQRYTKISVASLQEKFMQFHPRAK